MENYYIEDILIEQLNIMKERMYPDCKYKKTVFLLELIHSIGVLYIMFGLFIFPIKYSYLHLFFTLFNLFLFYIFNEKCYITLVSNFLSGNKGYLLKCRDVTVRKFLCLISIISFFILLYYRFNENSISFFNN